MPGLFSLYTLLRLEEKRFWVKVRILHETEKAVLVEVGIGKQWIPKSRIDGIRIKDKNFELYVKESVIS